jgi:SAM-dependent methyltransferase
MSGRLIGAKPARAGWSNADNAPFYSRLGVGGLRERAIQCGLTRCPDLRALSAHLGRAIFHTPGTSVLEIGAGYGRVAEWLLPRFPRVSVTLVELSGPSSEHLRERFGDEQRVTIVESSILEASFPRAHRLALWLWAGFLDFPPEEKALALRRVAETLAPGGIIAIEVPRTVGAEVQRPSSSHLVLDFHGVRWRGHLPAAGEIHGLARSAGLLPFAAVPYVTATKLDRTLHLFQKGEARDLH